MKKVQGLTLWVYSDRMPGDCTNGGISSRYRELILVGDGIEGPVSVDLDDAPENVVRIVTRQIGGREYKHIEPLNKGGKWHMAGGNFAYTSDSRFPSDYPLSIHDRVEE